MPVEQEQPCLPPPCWSPLGVDSNTHAHCHRELRRDWMPPLPLNVSAPYYPKPAGYTVWMTLKLKMRLPSISSISVPADRMQEFSPASAYVFLQVQCCSSFRKHSLLRVILWFSNHMEMEMEMTHILEEWPEEHLHKGLLFFADV